jgi:acyl dehydratase
MKYEIGQTASDVRVITTADVKNFGNLIGDQNPIHMDKEFASQTTFGRPIVHGMFGASLISGLLATKLPGPGSIYLGQELRFHAPIFHEEKISVRVEVIDLIIDKGHAILKTEVCKEDGSAAISGVARVKIN